MLVVFAPFAAGYFLSFFFRNVNAVISKDLARDFALSPQELGFLTSMYLLAFAAFQLPLGVLLDRYGPRRVVAALMCVAGTGALVFGLAQDLTTLSIGRALIGLGVSGGLMGAIKAFSLWFPLSRMATLNGLYLGIGGLGGLSATAPVEALLGPFGWRVLFYGLAAASILAASLIFFVVPEKPLPGRGQTLRAQVAGFGTIFRSVAFWRIATPLVVCHAAYQALQGLWLAPWLYDIAGEPRAAVARLLLATAIAYAFGSVFFGVSSDRLARAGISRMTTYKIGLAISVAMFLLLASGVTRGTWAPSTPLSRYQCPPPSSSRVSPTSSRRSPGRLRSSVTVRRTSGITPSAEMSSVGGTTIRRPSSVRNSLLSESLPEMKGVP